MLQGRVCANDVGFQYWYGWLEVCSPWIWSGSTEPLLHGTYYERLSDENWVSVGVVGAHYRFQYRYNREPIIHYSIAILRNPPRKITDVYSTQTLTEAFHLQVETFRKTVRKERFGSFEVQGL